MNAVPGVPDGANMGHMSGTQSGSFWQKTSRTLEPFDYTLTVKLGREIGVPQAGAAIRVRLGNDVSGTILKSLSIPANSSPSDSFQTYTLNITKAESAAFLPANQGTNLVIELFGDMNTLVSGSFGRVDWDVVQFSYIPEPTTAALLGLAGLLLLRRRRLRLDGTKIIDDQEFLEVTGTRGEGTFLVPDQQLDDAEVQDLQRAVFGT